MTIFSGCGAVSLAHSFLQHTYSTAQQVQHNTAQFNTLRDSQITTRHRNLHRAALCSLPTPQMQFAFRLPKTPPNSYSIIALTFNVTS